MRSDEFFNIKSANCVDKNIQVFQKHKKPHRRGSRIDRNACQHEPQVITVAQQSDGGARDPRADYGRRSDSHSPRGRSPSSENSYDEEYNRIFMVRDAKIASDRNIQRRNSDISDYVTVMALETDRCCGELGYSESTTSASRRMSVSESNLQGCRNKSCPANKVQRECPPPPPCFQESGEDDGGGVCPHCRDLMKDTCPICTQGMLNMINEPATKCVCTPKKAKKKKNKNKCCKCSKRTSTDKVNICRRPSADNLSDLEREGRCPPCGLCPDECTQLKTTASEEQLAMERELTRCDCKTKMLKQRLVKAFNVCPKCRQPKYLCCCLEEMINEYKQSSGSAGVVGGIGGGGGGGKECCPCKTDAQDSLAKLLREVTNTCPKCGHRRRSCTCLEEMLWDVKRMLTKQNLAAELKKKKSCACQCKTTRRGGNTDVFFEEAFPMMDLSCEPGCRATQVFQAASQEISPRLSKHLMSKVDFRRQKICPGCNKSESSCDCNQPVIICKKCKMPEIICECKLHTKGKKESKEFHPKEQPVRKPHRKKTSDAQVYCECSVNKLAYDSRKANICQECLRPQYNCVCKQSPTCFKCGKRKDEESDARLRQQSRQFEAASERSRSTRKNRQETHSARETGTRYGPRNHNINYQPSAELVMRVRDSKVGRSTESVDFHHRACTERGGGTKFIAVGQHANDKSCAEKPKTGCPNHASEEAQVRKEDKGVSSSQSAFQKLRSHFLKCRTCGKRHTKREYECRQVMCYDDDRTRKHVSPENKDARGKRDKGRKSERDPKASLDRERRKERSAETRECSNSTKCGLVNVIMPPQERNSEESLAEYGQEISAN